MRKAFVTLQKRSIRLEIKGEWAFFGCAQSHVERRARASFVVCHNGHFTQAPKHEHEMQPVPRDQ